MVMVNQKNKNQKVISTSDSWQDSSTKSSSSGFTSLDDDSPASNQNNSNQNEALKTQETTKQDKTSNTVSTQSKQNNKKTLENLFFMIPENVKNTKKLPKAIKNQPLSLENLDIPKEDIKKKIITTGLDDLKLLSVGENKEGDLDVKASDIDFLKMNIKQGVRLQTKKEINISLDFNSDLTLLAKSINISAAKGITFANKANSYLCLKDGKIMTSNGNDVSSSTMSVKVKKFIPKDCNK